MVNKLSPLWISDLHVDGEGNVTAKGSRPYAVVSDTVNLNGMVIDNCRYNDGKFTGRLRPMNNPINKNYVSKLNMRLPSL